MILSNFAADYKNNNNIKTEKWQKSYYLYFYASCFLQMQ